ncbi:MAG: glycoside hydrolase family 13 protein [Eubacteriales bacterium]|nr:glycoside hydrolase family 13 protein [Eubacteriales bacterium]
MENKEFKCPSWLSGGLMYQIFPDRFSRSKAYLPPEQKKEYILREDWGGEPNKKADEKGIIKNNDFFGGNLRGVIEKIPYLADLGVSVIYLNPIFQAYSNHRYDTADYRKIDPLLGEEADLVELCAKAKESGIKVLLDGVFNHTGSDSVYFNKNNHFPELGAYQSKSSPYYKWYRFTEYPDKYEAWWGVDILPSVNEEEESFLDFIIRDKDSVIKHWLKCGISGYRLDVVDELPDLFLDEFRKAVKEFDEEAAIIGEVWEDAATKVSYGVKRRYLEGDQLDSVMNYPLRTAILRFLIEDGNAETFGKELETLQRHYPKTVFYGLMNLLGTHDTPRILTLFKEAFEHGEAVQRLYSALFLWGFLPGIPCLYYGDELGMEGGRDPENRRCFEPEKANRPIEDFYKKFLSFRAALENYEALGSMEFVPRSAKKNLYSFERKGEQCRILVAVNGGDSSALLPLDLTEGERLENFLLSGNVSFLNLATFSLKGISAVCALITKNAK